jgi:hypothetical protein
MIYIRRLKISINAVYVVESLLNCFEMMMQECP